MEYRRNRKSRYRKQQSGGKGGKALAFIIILAAAVYFVSISAVGSWLSKHVVEPVFSAFSANNNNASNANAGDIYKVSSESELDLPKLQCYALQMGVFSTEERAEALANTVKSQGGGGYVYNDNGKYRVFASEYSNESDARSVKQRLMESGTECSVHELSTPGTSFDMSITSGTNATASEIRSVFIAILSAHDDLLELEQNFDADKMTSADGAKAAKAIYDELISASKDKASLPQAIVSCLDNCCAALKSLSEASSASSAEFASLLKYTQLTLACEFTQTVNSLIKI